MTGAGTAGTVLPLNLFAVVRDIPDERQGLGGRVMTNWHDSMVDRPESDGASYATGWTISGLAVLGTIVVVWVLGI